MLILSTESIDESTTIFIDTYATAARLCNYWQPDSTIYWHVHSDDIKGRKLMLFVPVVQNVAEGVL